ncbi:putative mitochondrial hypothetical protein [Leptomonas pyrrhocoris]|uniref:Uncharacterized protein n=1 Tax=Leptomonas pyrrhocoris TaxID=157538 RepID=A0A0N0VFV6_LEPPY|nr:putative mitochondrial hypothetical protein [Leptomonas pyrrhocoris]KPA81601.1 putative mitochondrial hypothetical protein [Leptomonas pyrrhocoris]|eukprot:XP_015660040.1 putative mitochondrial hypothetical protein [Leptomonas pyrrhocoris]
MSATLIQLLQRAANTSKPYNCQDAVLTIKALSALRLHRPEVRTICERACFSLASSPGEVSAPIVIDVVNHLSSMQSSHLLVVQKVLVRRFCELPLRPSRGSSTPSVDPRTAQKAALALIKLGRSPSSEAAVEHVLRLLHTLLLQHAHDVGLHTAYVALYTYSVRYAAQPQWWCAPQPHRPSVVTLAGSIRFLLAHVDVYTHASGSVALQLLHLLLVLPLSSSAPPITASGIAPQHIKDFEAYVSTGAMARAVSGGVYAGFLQAVVEDVCKVSPDRACLLWSGVFAPGNLADVMTVTTEGATALSSSNGLSIRRMNVYDVAKLANAAALTFSALATTLTHASLLAGAHGETVSARDDAEDDGDVMERGQPSLAHFIEGDDARVEAARLCLRVLDSIVLWQQQQLHLPESASASAGTGLFVGHTSPDNVLVASLLHAYAKASRCQHAPPLAVESVTSLLRLVPKLSDTAPMLLSWMLMSLTVIANDEVVNDVSSLSSSGTFLFRQYVHFPSTKRRLRCEVETLYSCLRLMEALSSNVGNDPSKQERPQEVLTESGGGGSDTVAASGFVSYRDWQPEDADESHETTNALLVSVSDLAPLMRETALRLIDANATKAPTVHWEDVDMLLAVLIDVYSSPRASASTRGNDGATEARSFQEALGALQNAVLDFLESTLDEKIKDNAHSFSLRTVRLGLLSSLVANAATKRGDFAERLQMIQLSYTQHLQHAPTTANMDSAMMLQCLALLQRGRPISPASHVLLGVLCGKYQAYVNQCAESAPQLKTVEGIVRVFRRAREAGVKVVYEVSAKKSAAPSVGAKRLFGKADEPALSFPFALCRSEVLTTHAASDLLQLLCGAPLPDAALTDSRARVLHQIASSLLTQLRRTADTNSMIRVLQVSKVATASQCLFPSKGDLVELLHCTEAHTSCLLRGLDSDTQVNAGQTRRAQQASRFLAAVSDSQLFFRLPAAALNESHTLRTNLLKLAQYVERNERKADKAAVLKIKLLCGGVV